MMNSAAKMKKGNPFLHKSHTKNVDMLSKVELHAEEFAIMDALKSYVGYVSDTA